MLDRGYLAEVGAVAAALLFFVMLGTHESLDQLGDQQRCTPPFIKHCFRHPEVLQYWGERWCRLGFNAQKRQRYPFAIVVGLTALVFGSFRLMSLTYACMCMMLYVCLRLLWMRVEGYGGWFYAFLESFVEIILLNIIIMMTSRNPLRDGAVVLILAVTGQFGFQREINSGERVRLASMITLGLVRVMLLGLVCFALSSVSDDNWSAFGEYMGSTKFYEIPHLPPNMTQKDVNTFPLCLVRFPHGAVGSGNALDFSKELSLADFGLMASLTYEHLGRESSDGIHGEPPSRVEEGCAHYFPNWHVEQKPPSAWAALAVDGGHQQIEALDWTQRLPCPGTTVIAVRGTLNALDVLHDVTLWLVPTVLQLCNYIGPDVSDGAWGISMSRLSALVPLAPIRKQTTFDSVFLAVKYMMSKHPNRWGSIGFHGAFLGVGL
ncbi:unnamed protein product [Cladocopium goreaui]|uniref:Serine/threonine-protein phosphatase 2A 65 kDa regulatory subunit A beta isoform n=1 Tax=Cladocopium goreaui TaxID=2562237 RepID=A0A9P1G8Z1_9DINO|nr:unnamed protein product [Cladocopium goreaui]